MLLLIIRNIVAPFQAIDMFLVLAFEVVVLSVVVNSRSIIPKNIDTARDRFKNPFC